MQRFTHAAGALGLCGLLLAAAGCQSAIPAARPFGFTHFGQSEFADTDDDGLPDQRLPDGERSAGEARRGTVAHLDDITNEASQKAGFFGDGAAAADSRGRTGKFFAGGLESPLEPAPAPRPEARAPATGRKMVYTAAFGIMVPAVDEAIGKLMARVQELGGYLSRRQDATLTVRIPAQKFESFVAEMPGFGRVVSESRKANDVTARHTDLTIRLENAEKSRKRLLALLDKATKMEDVIKIEEALRRITAEIETMKGQLELLNNQIALSTITVAFQANAPQAQGKRRKHSRFGWINRIGIEQDLRRFRP